MGNALTEQVEFRRVPLDTLVPSPHNTWIGLQSGFNCTSGGNDGIMEVLKILVPGGACNTPGRIHLLRRCIVDTLPPHGQNGNIPPTKYCPRCQETLDIACFSKNRTQPDGLNHYCRSCRKATRKAHPGERKYYAVTTDTHKYCSGCNQDLEISHFHKNRTNPDGLARCCTACRSAERKAYYAANKEKSQIWHQNYYPQHKDEYAARGKRWHEDHRDEHNAMSRANYENNKDVYNERSQKWKKEHPEVAAAAHSRRRISKQNNGGSFTPEEWRNLKEFYNYTCLRCKKQEPEIELTADHVMPIVLGGVGYISNIQPLCRSCNSWKGAKYVDYREETSNGQSL